MKNNFPSDVSDPQTINVLVIDDSEDDVRLLMRELQKGGYHPEYDRIETSAAMKKALREKQWDVILCDYKMPHFNAPSALALLKEANIDIPVIIVSGTIGEEKAVECMRSGAHDYILKGNYSRLCPVITRELEELKNRNSKKQMEVQKKAALKQLHHSEERYHKITQCIPDLIWVMDLSGRFIYANDAVERTHGWTVEEYVKLTLQDLVSPQQVAKNAVVLEAELMKTRNPDYDRNSVITFESEELRKDGTTFWAEVTAAFLWSEDGKPDGVIGITRDVTERRKAIETLQKSEEKYRLITEKMSDIVWMTDLNFKLKYITPSIQKVLGFTQEERMNQTLDQQMTPASVSIVSEALAKELALEKQGQVDPQRTVTLTLEYYHKDGSTRWMEVVASGIRNDQGVLTGIHGVSRDITQRKKAEEELKKSEAQYRLLADHVKEFIWTMDLNLKYTYVSPSVEKISGYTSAEIKELSLDQVLPPESLRKAQEIFSEEMSYAATSRISSDHKRSLELQFRCKDGHLIWLDVTVSFILDENGSPVSILGESRDITERRMMEDALRKSEEQQAKLVNAIPDMIIYTTPEGNIFYVNDHALKISGYSWEDVKDQNLLNFIVPEEHGQAIENLAQMREGRRNPREYHLILKDGRRMLFEVNGDVLYNQDGTPFAIVNVCRDITERRQTEKILREKDERLRGIAENLPGVMFQFRTKNGGEYEITYLSEPLDEFAKIISAVDMENLAPVFPEFLSRIHEEDRERFLASIKTAVETVSRWNFEGRVAIQSGKLIWFQGLSVPTRLNDRIVFNGILLNISERKLAEENLQKSEEKFYKIFMTTPDCIALTRLSDGLMIDVNKGFEDIVGWRREMVIGTKSTESPMHFWVNLSDRDLMAKDLKAGRDILHREFKFRRSDGSERDGIYSARTISIDEQECLIFILRDITERKLLDAELQRTLESLRKSVGTTIQVMVSAIEMRDPYTAGHQTRVADLARAIATEMGLSHQQIDGIRLAGTIHDIGKLSIPAEILTKPTKLTAIEFSIIKEHSRSGYEMLKNVESPWPLAEIVYQHHERMNGTGYPRNLKDDQILLEARILAVSDVVESMASHRPYRASLGIEAALDEITKNKGILYDEAIVDACLRLFREKGYVL